MPTLKGFDFANLSSALSEDESMIQNVARDFVEEAVMPVIREHHAAGTFPSELIPKMGELGFLGASLPEEYGCAGLGSVAQVVGVDEPALEDEQDEGRGQVDEDQAEYYPADLPAH